MGHMSYEQSKKRVYFGFWLLLGVTLLEVFVSLMGKGHIFESAKDMTWLIWLAAILIIGLSIYKAYFIVYDFMHMKHEVKGMRLSVVLPSLLLVWAIIAFFHEGDSWLGRRDRVKQVDKLKVEESIKPQGTLKNKETKHLDGGHDGHH